MYGLPRPEFLFKPAKSAKPVLRFKPLPRLPLGACAAGFAAAFLIGAAVARLPEPQPPSSAAQTAPLTSSTAPAALPPSVGFQQVSAVVARSAPGEVHTPARVSLVAQPAARSLRFPFQLQPSTEFTRVGPLVLRLNKTDPKRQTYTLTLLVGGKRVELQDRALAEPVRFYPEGGSLSEILIERIEPDLVSGYLSQPAMPGSKDVKK